MPSKLFGLNELPPVPVDGSPNEQIIQLYNYLFELRLALNYILQNLDVNNWNAASLTKLQSNMTRSIEERIKAGDIAKTAQDALDTANSAYQIAEINRINLEYILPFIDMLMRTIRLNEDGSVSIGIDNEPLHLHGDIYINGIQWTEG